MKAIQKNLFLILCLLLLMSGCTNNQRQVQLTFNSINELTFAPPIGEQKNGQVIYKNVIINEVTKETGNLVLDNDLLLMDIFPPQQAYNLNASYYNNKIIYGGLNAGGKSVIIELDAEGKVFSQVLNFNIIYYDDIKDIYVRQSLPNEEQGFYYLDKDLEEIDFVSLPSNIDIEQPFSLDILSLERVVFFGKNIDGVYQLLVYDFIKHDWKYLNLPLEIDSTIEVYVNFLYSDLSPEYIHVYIHEMVDIINQKSVAVNKLYSINLYTSAQHEKDLSLTKKIVQTQDMNDVFLTYDKNGVDIYTYNLDSVELKQSIYIEDIALVGDYHINKILQYNKDYIVVETPYGVFKFDFNENQAETIYDNIT